MSKNKINVKFKLSRVSGGVDPNRVKKTKKINHQNSRCRIPGHVVSRDPHGAGDVITIRSGNK